MNKKKLKEKLEKAYDEIEYLKSEVHLMQKDFINIENENKFLVRNALDDKKKIVKLYESIDSLKGILKSRNKLILSLKEFMSTK